MDWNRISGAPQLASGQQYFYGWSKNQPKRKPLGAIRYSRGSSGELYI